MRLPEQCIVHISAGSQIIQDADEEVSGREQVSMSTDDQIMELYMARPSDAHSTGASALGYLRSQGSTVHVDLRLAPTTSEVPENLGIKRHGRKERKAADRNRTRRGEEDVREVSLKLHQDMGTLSSEKGDTGRSRDTL
jgi:hypothetical protein